MTFYTKNTRALTFEMPLTLEEDTCMSYEEEDTCLLLTFEKPLTYLGTHFRDARARNFEIPLRYPGTDF